MKKVLLVLAKLPNIHNLHETITEGYELWNGFYKFMCKMGLGARASLEEQAAPTLPAEPAAPVAEVLAV